jgi:Tfp pilus assembly protein PilO
VGERRGPIIAGVAVAVAFLLVMFFLVLPKMGQVKDANKTLQDAQTQQSTLDSQLAALKQAETDAPKNRETIRKVDQAIPPTADQQGFILLMQNAAVLASVDIFTLTPSAPVFDPLTGLSTIPNGVSATGSYFSITEFLFNIETLPRAAKVTSLNITASPSETEPNLLTLTASIDIYTSDSSAGPGSSPGPTSGTTGTTTGATTTTTPPSVSPAAESSGA